MPGQRIFISGRAVIFDVQASGHAQMHQEIQAVVEGEINLLAATLGGHNARALQVFDELGNRRKSSSGQTRPCTFDFQADYLWL